MLDNTFMNLYWKQFLMIEKEFRKSVQCVSLSNDNLETYSDFFSKIILQVGSEVDVLAKVLCKEINAASTTNSIEKYKRVILKTYPEIERLTVSCNDIDIIPWKDWSNTSPLWWKVYNGIKHNRADKETYDGITKENYKFASLKNAITSLAGLYVLEIYLYNNVTDSITNIDTPIPRSRLFKAIDQGWENKRFFNDSSLFFDDWRLVYVESDLLYGDL
ncbi:hypothetical protein [Butyrivibrio sp.]|jgi:hypothetical protein|uniref:hypothetical protein n=1 Tax=Butyrivibrio sp. TaxID=28121 RepID=UPI0025BFC80E|nr:hypothetical protein [Butyrivibrio sp.]MBE5839570.1 hypothetical protein [Butyrivibrio sp.]